MFPDKVWFVSNDEIIRSIIDLILDFEHIYRELDVKIIDRGESFYQSRMIEVVKELESKSKLIYFLDRNETTTDEFPF